jgi:iron-sulfur cluster repair protein YtfE (RIC family)
LNAIDLLKQDHETVAELFKEVRATPPSRHPAIFATIKAELDTHSHIEETVLYPRLLKDGNKELKDITNEGIEEHHQIKLFLKELTGLKKQKDVFEAKLKVLMEDVEHHVEEEEDDMFPMMKDHYETSVLEKIGEALERKKKAYVRSHTTVAKNLVDRAEPKGTMAKIYDKAITAVIDMLPGGVKKPKSRSAKSNGKAPARKKTAGNGKSSPKTKAAANGRGTKTKSTARSAATRTSKAGLKPSKSSSTKGRSTSGRRGSAAK